MTMFITARLSVWSLFFQITAYGGKLRYAIYYEARDETGRTSYEPQVIIKGGPNKDKVMVRHMPALQIGQLTRHEIDITEVSQSDWRV